MIGAMVASVVVPMVAEKIGSAIGGALTGQNPLEQLAQGLLGQNDQNSGVNFGEGDSKNGPTF